MIELQALQQLAADRVIPSPATSVQSDEPPQST
jgi:hypothetical protein